MKNYKYILFDLDGTLTDPFEGITNSVAYSLKSYGIAVVDKRELACFIGPPLYESFEKYYGFSKEGAVAAVEKYREYFSDKGLFENTVYNGAVDLLRFLKENGYVVALATSKPEVYAKRILKYFDIEKYFDYIVGSLLSGERVKKGEVICEVLKQIGQPEKEKCIMIGDRSHDIIGAKENGIASVGVLYGYGNRAEFEEAKADKIVGSISELKDFLKG